jgi:hypothetical protein
VKARLFAALALVALPVAALPVPSSAEEALGGYSATSQSVALRARIYDPAIPIPAEPQAEANAGYARSFLASGPSGRGLASLIWPGDVLGDGIGVLAANDALDYPVKVNSKVPATDSAPPENSARTTGGSGMFTTANDNLVTAKVKANEIGVSIVSGPGTGLCLMLKQDCAIPDPGAEVPEPLASALVADQVLSMTSVTRGTGSIESRARSRISGISVLAGVVTIDGIDLEVVTSSNGKAGAVGGSMRISGLVAGGEPIDVESPIAFGTTPANPVHIPEIGLTISYLGGTSSTEGAQAVAQSTGLRLTFDLSVLSTALNTKAITDQLSPVVLSVPDLGVIVDGMLRLGTTYVVDIANVDSSAVANPAYVPPPVCVGCPPEVTDPGPVGSDDGYVAGPVASGPVVDYEPPATPITAPITEPVAYELPGLGEVPGSVLLLTGLAAGLVGWLLRKVGVLCLAGDECLLGASVGVPDLRGEK